MKIKITKRIKSKSMSKIRIYFAALPLSEFQLLILILLLILFLIVIFLLILIVLGNAVSQRYPSVERRSTAPYDRTTYSDAWRFCGRPD